ncbi:hypothetical protein [Microcystis phage Mel-JY01]
MKKHKLFEMAESLGLGKKFVPMQAKSLHPRETATRLYLENWQELIGMEVNFCKEMGLIRSFHINGIEYPVLSAYNAPAEVYIESYSNKIVFGGAVAMIMEFEFPMTREQIAEQIEKEIVARYIANVIENAI